MRKVYAIVTVIGLIVLLGTVCSCFLQEGEADFQISLESENQILSETSSKTAVFLTSKSSALVWLDLIAKMELAMADIEKSFALSITSTKEELSSLQQQQVDSYKTTNAQDPWETQAEFNSRVSEYRSGLIPEGEARVREIERQRDTEIGKIQVQLEQTKRELKSMRFILGPTSTKVTVSKFDAENKRFPIQVTSTDSSLPFDVSVFHIISSSDREVLQREYERIDNADKEHSLVGELTYALEEAYSGIWRAYVVSEKILNLLEGSTDNPGVAVSFSEGASPLGRDVFYLTESGEVRPFVTVTLDRQNGTAGSDSVLAAYGSAMCSAMAPQRIGYFFDGYYDQVNGGGSKYYTSAMESVRNWDKTNAVTLYAKWIEIKLNDIGPAGGYIFYDKRFYSDGWRYLEAAPAGWSGEEKDPFYRIDDYSTISSGDSVVVGTGTAFGSGKANTTALITAMENKAYSTARGIEKIRHAAKVCRDLVVTKNGVAYDDWFLPSRDELNRMYENFERNKLGDFSDSYYWSSSECGDLLVWTQNFGSGVQYGSYRGNNSRVRPVRAF